MWSPSAINSCNVWVPGWQIDERFGLAQTEMQVVLVVGDRFVQRRQCDIDEQVMVTRVGLVGASGGDADIARAEPHLDVSGAHHLAVVRPTDVNVGIVRTRCALGRSLRLRRRGLSHYCSPEPARWRRPPLPKATMCRFFIARFPAMAER
jgi:hypothetical protein